MRNKVLFVSATVMLSLSILLSGPQTEKYSIRDAYILGEIIKGTIPEEPNDLNRYDFDHNGKLNLLDWLQVRKIVLHD